MTAALRAVLDIILRPFIAVACILLALFAIDTAAHARLSDVPRAKRIAATVYPTKHVPRIVLADLRPGRAAEAVPWGCDTPEHCVVRYDRAWLATATRAETCSMTIHEYGHLYGWYRPGSPDGGFHSEDPRSNMHRIPAHHPACGLSDAQRARLVERARNARYIIRHTRSARRRAIYRRILRSINRRLRA